MTTAVDVLNKARSQLGTFEVPANSNITPYSEWYGVIGAWCGMFVSWCFYQCGLPLPATTEKGFAYTPFGAEWFQANGAWRGPDVTAEPGWVVFFDFPNDAYLRIAHVGIIEHANADGSVTCLEGNTVWGGGRNGGEVMRHVRTVAGSGIQGYGVPDFASSGRRRLGRHGLLRVGQHSEMVRAWKYRLRRSAGGVGAGVTTSDEFGEATQAVTKAFQRDKGLDDDGRVGRLTMDAMHSTETHPELRNGSSDPAVNMLKARLNAIAGAALDPESPVFGANTESRVKDFQRFMGLDDDGVVGGDTWDTIAFVEGVRVDD